jgi:hypothetical protein
VTDGTDEAVWAELPNVWIRRLVLIAGLVGGVALTIALGFGLPRAGAPSEAGPAAILAFAGLLWFLFRWIVLRATESVDAEIGEEASAKLIAVRRANWIWPLPIILALALFTSITGMVALVVVRWWLGILVGLAAIIATVRFASKRAAKLDRSRERIDGTSS